MKSATRKHDEALLYFTDRIRQSHQAGHIEDILVLPYELHMISSGSAAADLPEGQKAG